MVDSQHDIAPTLRGIGQRRRERAMLAIMTGRIQNKSRKRKRQELDIVVDETAISGSQLIPSIDADESRTATSDDLSVARTKSLYKELDKRPIRQWASWTPYRPLMTLTQHFEATCLVAPQGFKDASTEACRCIAAMTQYEPGHVLIPYRPVRLPQVSEVSFPSCDSGPSTPTFTATMTLKIRQDQQQDDQSDIQQSSNYVSNGETKPAIDAPPFAQQRSISATQSSSKIQQTIINAQEMLSQGFSAYCRWNTGQLRQVPHRNPLNWDFNASEWFRIGQHRTLEEAINVLDNNSSWFTSPPRCRGHELFFEKYITIEAECIQQVLTWVENRVCRKRDWAACFKLDVSLLPIQSGDDWLKEVDPLRVMALITTSEIIDFFYTLADSGYKKVTDQSSRGCFENPGPATTETGKEIEAQDKIEQEILSLLVESVHPSEIAREHWKNWGKLREFCRMLREPFVPNGRRAIWELILEYEYGLTVDVILDPALL